MLAQLRPAFVILACHDRADRRRLSARRHRHRAGRLPGAGQRQPDRASMAASSAPSWSRQGFAGRRLLPSAALGRGRRRLRCGELRAAATSGRPVPPWSRPSARAALPALGRHGPGAGRPGDGLRQRPRPAHLAGGGGLPGRAGRRRARAVAGRRGRARREHTEGRHSGFSASRGSTCSSSTSPSTRSAPSGR